VQPGQAVQPEQAGQPDGAAPVRIAIAGTGNIAGVHAAALRGLPGAELVGAADIDRARLAGFGAEHGLTDLHTDLAGLLAAAQPDLVHLCTPPALHFEQAGQCLAAGASVLAEKPPTLSLRELDLLADLTRPGGPWFATVFQHRFGSAAGRLRALAGSGVLGRPLLAICHTTWFRDQAYFDVPWRGRWQTEGGGPTMGHGIHQMDLLRYVLGDWAEISAIARRQARRTETEDLSMAHVIFASGAAASVVNSVLSPREESYLRFDFEHGTVEVSHLYGYRDEDWRVTPAPGHEKAVLAAWPQPTAGRRPQPTAGTPSGHRAQFAAVLAALRAAAAPPVTLPDSRGTMSLVAGLYAAAFGGGVVRPADLGAASPCYDRMDGLAPGWEQW
jgi:predicted dehydrogenase